MYIYIYIYIFIHIKIYKYIYISIYILKKIVCFSLHSEHLVYFAHHRGDVRGCVRKREIWSVCIQGYVSVGLNI